jgi:hypothetical protein
MKIIGVFDDIVSQAPGDLDVAVGGSRGNDFRGKKTRTRSRYGVHGLGLTDRFI